MLGFGAIGEYTIGEVGPLPFEARATVGFVATGTPSLIRVGQAQALISFTAEATMRVIVLASAHALVSFTAEAQPNFVLYAATREFISRASDQIPNQPFYGTLEQTLQFDASIVAGDGFGRVSLGWGELTLINSDGYYDDIIRRYVADGRRVVISIGDERNVATTGFDGFHTVFDGTATGIHVEEDSVRVLLRDNTYKLETPVQRSIYGGTGGLDGTEDLKGKRKPRALGYCPNVTPAFVIPNLASAGDFGRLFPRCVDRLRPGLSNRGRSDGGDDPGRQMCNLPRGRAVSCQLRVGRRGDGRRRG
jgi:hypothetical protein